MTLRNPRLPSPANEVFAAGGMMGARMAALNWSHTPLGPVQSWPQSLRTAVSICLTTRVPLMLVWGPEYTQLYNDALLPLLGDKHPAALGASYRDCFSEIWDYQGPQIKGVFERGESTYHEDQQIFFERNGLLEEMYWTFSWSPIRDETGGIGGAFHPASETTHRVLGVRRLAALRDLATETSGARSVRDACAAVLATLAEHRTDLPNALLYLLEVDGGRARLAGSAASPQAASPQVECQQLVDLHGPIPPAAWPLARAVITGASVVTAEDLGVGSRTVVLPLARPGRSGPGGLLVAGLNPGRPLDDDYLVFLELVAGHVATVITNAHAQERESRIAETLQRSLLPALPEIPGLRLCARYVPSGAAAKAGGDWYDVFGLSDGTTALAIGDVMGHDVRAATAMGQLRSVLRSYAWEGGAPAVVLDRLDRLVQGLEMADLATALYARLEPGGPGRPATLRYANAGHLPPILRLPDGTARLLEGGQSVLIGAPLSDERTEAVEELPPGSTLVLYTDGLVEKRTTSLDVGLERLRRLVAAAPLDLDVLCDQLLTSMGHGPMLGDDIALLTVHLV